MPPAMCARRSGSGMLPWEVVAARSSPASRNQAEALDPERAAALERAVPCFSISRHFSAPPAVRSRSASLTIFSRGLLADDHEHGDRERLGEPLQIDDVEAGELDALEQIVRMCAWNRLAWTSSIRRSVALLPSRRTVVESTPSRRVRAQTAPTTRTSPRCSRSNSESSTPTTLLSEQGHLGLVSLV